MLTITDLIVLSASALASMGALAALRRNDELEEDNRRLRHMIGILMKEVN